jgi:hypothetical protein
MRASHEPVDLGPVVSEYRRTLAVNLRSLGWIVPALVVAVAAMVMLLVGGFGERIDGWTRPAMIAALIPVVWLLVSSVVFVARSWDLRLTLCKRGMRQVSWRGSDIVRWDQVAEVWIRGEREVALRCVDGKDVLVDGVTWTDEPVRRISALTLSVMLPAAHETLRRGGRLQFGPIAVTRKALDVRGNLIPWADVELRPGLHGAMLTIRDRGTHRVEFVSLRDVPNVHLLRAVLPASEAQG